VDSTTSLFSVTLGKHIFGCPLFGIDFYSQLAVFYTILLGGPEV
jgi:hypothetical protein